jgi:hypothetical protein
MANLQNTLIKTILEGGYYWPQHRSDSPGHSIVLANGTPFVIREDGPRSHVFCHGTLRDGYFIPDEGEFAGRKFPSANAVVNTVREPSTNAFLYLEFAIDGEWIFADNLRQSADSQLDEVEEEALRFVRRALRRRYPKKQMDEVEVVQRAAKLVATNPRHMDRAREFVAFIESEVSDEPEER